MRNDTRTQFERYCHRVAQLSGVNDATKRFNVEPSVQQTLENKIQESSDFLGMINMVGVDELKGEKLGLTTSGPVAGRTNVDNKDREPRDVKKLDPNGYECQFTEFDTYIRYATMDAWAKFPDFQARLRNAIVRQQALDRIMIGWNGTSAATQTDRTSNPMLEDVNEGWIQKYRDRAEERVMSEGKEAGKVVVGNDGDYKNLDALVFDAVNSLIDPWARESPDLIVMISRKLLSDKLFPIINTADQKATEHRAVQEIQFSAMRLGGLQAAGIPYMPEDKIVITTPDNLSLYWQIGGRRRYIKEEPERNRVSNYESSNDDYVVEDYGFGCVIENIELKTTEEGATEE